MYTIVIPKAELQRAVATKFPVKIGGIFLMSFEMSDPELYFKNDQVGLKVHIELNTYAPSSAARYKGPTDIHGAVAYDRNTRTFYLRDVTIERLWSVERFHYVPEFLSRAEETVKELVKNEVERLPIYSLTSKNVKHLLIRWFLKEVSVSDDKLILSLGL